MTKDKYKEQVYIELMIGMGTSVQLQDHNMAFLLNILTIQ